MKNVIIATVVKDSLSLFCSWIDGVSFNIYPIVDVSEIK
jgi:hypothetical protein